MHHHMFIASILPLLPCKPSMTSIEIVQQDTRVLASKDALPEKSAPASRPDRGPQSLTTESAAPAPASQKSEPAGSEVQEEVVSQAVSPAAATADDGKKNAAPPAMPTLAPHASQPMKVCCLPCSNLLTCHHSSTASLCRSVASVIQETALPPSWHTKRFWLTMLLVALHCQVRDGYATYTVISLLGIVTLLWQADVD